VTGSLSGGVRGETKPAPKLQTRQNGDEYDARGGVRGDGEGWDSQKARYIHRADPYWVSYVMKPGEGSELMTSAAFDFVLLGVMWTQLLSYIVSSRRDSLLNRAVVVSGALPPRHGRSRSRPGYKHICGYSDIHLASPANPPPVAPNGSTLAYICHLFAFNFGTYSQLMSWKCESRVIHHRSRDTEGEGRGDRG
jgi:hypothetical protein